MVEHNLPESTATPLFISADFFEVNQLADVLFDPSESAIELHSEHELVTRAWINSALYNSELAKRCSSHFLSEIKAAWKYNENGKLTRASVYSTEKVTTLILPALSLEQRVRVLQHYCVETLQTHLLTVPSYTIQKAVEWQSRYCPNQYVLETTIVLLQRAVNRFLLTYTNEQQAATLEPHHVADVLVDWQQVHAPDLLRSIDDHVELKIFLTETILGQPLALEQFLQTKNSQHLFLLAGPTYSGKKTFAESVAQFTHGAKHFCITLNLSFFESDVTWPDIFLTSPLQPQQYMRFTDILQHYPQAIMLLTQAHENPELLARLQREIKRGFFQVNDQCVSVAKMTWMIAFDTEMPELMPSAIQESIFSDSSPVELADILYRPSISPVSSSNEEYQFSDDYPLTFVKKYFSAEIVTQACVLTFLPLSEKSKKLILNKEIKRIIQRLRDKHQIALYYQEEIAYFLLNRLNKENQGFDDLHKNLYPQVENIVLKALEKGTLMDEEILMLQLNDTGQVLHVVRTNTKAGVAQSRIKI